MSTSYPFINCSDINHSVLGESIGLTPEDLADIVDTKSTLSEEDLENLQRIELEKSWGPEK